MISVETWELNAVGELLRVAFRGRGFRLTRRPGELVWLCELEGRRVAVGLFGDRVVLDLEVPARRGSLEGAFGPSHVLSGGVPLADPDFPARLVVEWERLKGEADAS